MIARFDHRICVTHLYANYKDEGHRGMALNDKLWVVATTYTEADFYKEMREIRGISNDTYEYLAKIDLSTWSRAWFNTFLKWDLLVKNLYECFNAYILMSHDQPIITILEMIRKILIKRYQTKRDDIRAMTGRLCAIIVQKFDEIGEEAIHCYITYAETGLFEVTCKKKQYVVNLVKKLVVVDNGI